MPLTIITENENTIEEKATMGNRVNGCLFLTYSENSDLQTYNLAQRTAYYYRCTVPGLLVNFSNNIAYNVGSDLHRLSWMAHTSLVATHGIVVTKPGVMLGIPFTRDLIHKIGGLVANHGANWGLLRGEHDKYFVINPNYSYVYKSNNIDEIEECCKANSLEIIIDNDMIYDRSQNDIDYAKWTEDDFPKDLYLETKWRLSPKNKSILRNLGKTNIIYHKNFTEDIKSIVKDYKHSDTFSTVEELKEKLEQYPSDTIWLIGDFLTSMMTFLTTPFNELMILTARVRYTSNSIVIAKLYDTGREIHSETFNV